VIGTLALGSPRKARAQSRRSTVAAASRRARRPARAAVHRRAPRVALRFGAAPRIFVLSAGVLATAFLTALLYLRFATSIAATGYDLHALQQRRDELRRENELLQLQVERLDAPARIEAEARRLGLVKAGQTLFLDTGPRVTLR
jgi:cell division protein FtsB